MNPFDIKALLGKRGITQTQIARVMRVSPQMVRRVIFNQSASARIAEAISRAVGKPVSELWPLSYKETLASPANCNAAPESIRTLSAAESASILDTVFEDDGHAEAKPYCELRNLFGLSTASQAPEHLLGALLCATNDYCAYSAELNPYPSGSSHQAGVETGWRMACAAMNNETTSLPGTL